MKPKIIFHVIGGPVQGFGHVIRSVNLANSLCASADIVFSAERISSTFLDELPNLIGPEIHHVDHLGADAGTAQAVVDIFDGYDFTKADMAARKSLGHLVVRIDDRAGDYRTCDMFICHGPQADQNMFQVSPGCRQLLGPFYALINKSFYEHRACGAMKVRRLFLSLGAGPHGEGIALILSELLPLMEDIEIHAVAVGYKKDKTLIPFTNRANITFYESLEPEAVARLMASSDAAVVAGGTMCLETAAVGLPSVLVSVADNQISVCDAMDRRGMALYAGHLFDGHQPKGYFGQQIQEFLKDADRRDRIAANCLRTFRESGVDQVAGEILSMIEAHSDKGTAGVNG